jgi:hypothetical protein
MGITEGKWEQMTPQSDLQIFVGAGSFADTSAHAVLATQGAGLFDFTLAAGLAATFFTEAGLFLRTGVLATPAFDQEQYGTAASQPGPSAVAGTSSPFGFVPGFPPLTAANMATLGKFQTGAVPKGMQVNSLDVVYTVGGAAATAPTVGMTRTAFANNVAPVVTNIITLGTNGLATAVQAQPYVINVPVTTPAMITTTDSAPIINFNITAGASTGTVTFYGVIMRCSYNMN